MEKNVEIILLFDYYGSLLTEKQQEVINLYYNLDYSLSEIADNLSISRQGVRDTLKKAETALFNMENNLGFLNRMNEIKKQLCEIKETALNSCSDNNDKTINDKFEYIAERLSSLCN